MRADLCCIKNLLQELRIPEKEITAKHQAARVWEGTQADSDTRYAQFPEGRNPHPTCKRGDKGKIKKKK